MGFFKKHATTPIEVVVMSSRLFSSAKLLHLDNPIRSLTVAFWLWKALLFLAITACPGSGYDTSTTLIPYEASGPALSAGPEPLSGPLKFVRWDSIYYLHVAQTGYVFEQEWAFGWGYTKLLDLFISGIHLCNSPHLSLRSIDHFQQEYAFQGD